jgi:hypothetical protein
MNPTNEKPPRRLREREGENKPATATINPPLSESKHFDPVEKKLGLAFDAIDTYRRSTR